MTSEQDSTRAPQFWHGMSVGLSLGVGLTAGVSALLILIETSSPVWIYLVPWVVLGLAVAIVSLEGGLNSGAAEQ